MQLDTQPKIQVPKSNPNRGPRRAMERGVLFCGAALGALAAANAVIAWQTPSLGARLSGGFNRTPLRFGDGAYFVAGSGAPLLFLHDVSAGSSSAQWQENFEFFARHFTVYAPDFLGWGLSDKPRHILRAADYAEQIAHFCEDVIGANANDANASTPVAVIASGRACGFAILAAQQAPELFSKFILVCPSVSEEYSVEDDEEEPRDARRNPVWKILTLPILGNALINFLCSRARLEKSARRDGVFDAARTRSGWILSRHIAAHQAGASHALAAVFSDALKVNWREAWSTLAQPALLVWGRYAGEFSSAPEWLALKPDADLEVIDNAKNWPHIERAEDFNARILRWLRR